MLPRCASIIDGTNARRDREDVAQVDVVHLLPRLRRRIVERHQRPVVADVVHQHVDPPVLGEHGLGQPGDVVVGGDVDDVAADRSTRAGDFVVDAVRALPIDLGDLDERAVLGEQPGDARADAVAAAGDHRDPAVEQPVPVVDGRDAVVRRAGPSYLVTGHGDGL